MAFVGTSPVFAHNGISDAIMIEQECKRAGLNGIPRAKIGCTQRMARQLMPGANLSLDDLCATLGVDSSPRMRGHSALIDAELAAECLTKMTVMAGPRTLPNIGIKLQTAAERRLANRDRPLVSCEISDDGKFATFSLADEQTLTANVPEYPIETHQVSVTSSGHLVISAKDMPETPSNPSGPAMIKALKNGSLLAINFVGDRMAGAEVWPTCSNILDKEQSSEIENSRP